MPLNSSVNSVPSDGVFSPGAPQSQRQLDAGWRPDFLPETEAIRNGDWQVAPIPQDLQDRRVEITGPTDRKMVINALNSGANVSSWPISRMPTRRPGRT